MVKKVETFIKNLAISLQAAKIYTTEHPKFKESIENTFETLTDILKEKDELLIGIVEEEFTFEKEIFFDLSNRLKTVIDYFKKQGIEKILFRSGLEKEELIKFIDFFTFSLDKFGTKDLNRDISKYLLNIGIRNISISKLAISGEIREKDSIDCVKLYEEFSEKSITYLEKLLNQENIDSLELEFTISAVMDTLLSNYKDFLKISVVKTYEQGTFNHLLNVAMLAMYFSYKLLFAKNVIRDIGIAGLFHDIGKIYISKKIILKPDVLTEDEFSKIKSHTVLGAELLLNYTDTLGILPVVVAFEHHIGFDGMGYPKLSFFHKPTVASMIVSICDTYDALLQRRVYRREYPPVMVYNFMMEKRGNFFEPTLLDSFFKIMGVYPPSTIVKLNDGRIAVVREENEDDIFSPKVEVIAPQQNKELIDLKEEKDNLKIESFLNPFKEGKKYLGLI